MNVHAHTQEVDLSAISSINVTAEFAPLTSGLDELLAEAGALGPSSFGLPVAVHYATRFAHLSQLDSA